MASAQHVFTERNYHEASVSEVCRRAGVALGTFYQYFEDKEAIFSEVAARLSASLQSALLEALRAHDDLRTRLERFVMTSVAFARENRALYGIFREAEFVTKRIHHRFYDGLIAILSDLVAEARRRGQARDVDEEVAAVAVIGATQFLILRWIVLGAADVPERARATTLDFLLHGIDTGRPLRHSHKLQTDSSMRPLPGDGTRARRIGPEDAQVLSRGEATRRKLLEAARVCFGRYGFYATSIAEITRRAGVSLGAFYLYFSSKTEILDELVRDINTRLRRTTRAAIAGLADRREIEREGFRAFFRFIGENREAYRIVREAEFVNPAIAQWYFDRLAQGYIAGLREGMAREEIRPLDPETLAYCLMGIGHFLGLRWIVWSRRSTIPKRVFDHTLDLILHGLEREETPRG